MKNSGVYEIINKITGDFYIGSSNDLERRKKEHFYESTWRDKPNKQLYKDMKQYGKDNFLFKIIQLCDLEELKKYEQIAIEKYNPKYNMYAACTGMSKKEYQKQYKKQYCKENADKIRQQKKQYRKEHADNIKQCQKQYYKQQCLYENELITLAALKSRFVKKGVKNPTSEAKKYLVGE